MDDSSRLGSRDKFTWIRMICRSLPAVYFLSRPRRFGKNLFLERLTELFVGLRINAGHAWSERHPVVRLSSGGGTGR